MIVVGVGMLAIVLEANPKVTWRYVQHLLVQAAVSINFMIIFMTMVTIMVMVGYSDVYNPLSPVCFLIEWL